MSRFPLILLISLLLLLASCHKESSFVSVSLGVSGLEQVQRNDSFDLGKGLLADNCTRISCALFQNGKKYKTFTQDITSPTFGSLQLRIPVGVYQMVLIAHSGAQHCTISTPEKITFNGKCTDTFFAYDTLYLISDTALSLTLRRAVAMFRLHITDSVPPAVSTMRFYYTGGSSTFDAVSGFGCVNSRQTEYREILPEMVGHTVTFQIYTFPHQEQDTLTVNLRALNSSEEILFEDTFKPVPIRLNWITEHSTKFFTDLNHERTVNISLQDSARWSGTITF